MSVPYITKTGEKSEISDYIRSISPAINLQLQLSCKDSTIDDSLPEAFRPKPKLSRTPPTEISGSTTISSEYNDNTFHSNTFNSPSLSVEYPPGSSKAIMTKQKKFQFKKSHYQKFHNTSSAKKTKEIRKKKSRFAERSQSESMSSIISFNKQEQEYADQLCNIKSNNFNCINNTNHIKDTKNNVTIQNNTTNENNDSFPPTPPSDGEDDIMYTLNYMKNVKNKLSSNIIILPKLYTSNKYTKTNKRNTSTDTISTEITVSSTPSVIETSLTTTKTNCTTTTKGYSFHTQNRKYETRQTWSTLTHQQHKQTTSIKTLRKLNKNVIEKQEIDPDQIRIALNEYDQHKGQNLEEIFRPQKSCCICIVL